MNSTHIAARLDFCPSGWIIYTFDVPVSEPLGASYRGEDARLKAAVHVLLKQLSPKKWG